MEPGIDNRNEKLEQRCQEAQEKDFGWALGILLRSYHAYLEAAVGDLPHGPRCYQILATVVHGNQPNQLGIATHLGIDRTVMTYLIDDFVTAGLVERQPDPNDRRARKIVATSHGKHTLEVLEQRVRAAEEKILGALTTAEQTRFRELIHRIAQSARHLSPETDPCDIVSHVLGDEPSSTVGES